MVLVKIYESLSLPYMLSWFNLLLYFPNLLLHSARPRHLPVTAGQPLAYHPTTSGVKDTTSWHQSNHGFRWQQEESNQWRHVYNHGYHAGRYPQEDTGGALLSRGAWADLLCDAPLGAARSLMTGGRPRGAPGNGARTTETCRTKPRQRETGTPGEA
jgi:hypothetical protein